MIGGNTCTSASVRTASRPSIISAAERSASDSKSRCSPQRTSGAGVTRYDSGWKAQGPGKYDFSYFEMIGTTKVQVPNPVGIANGSVTSTFASIRYCPSRCKITKQGGSPQNRSYENPTESRK